VSLMGFPYDIVFPAIDWKGCAVIWPVEFRLRINDQWRIISRWEKNDTLDVEITDYHR